MVSIRQIDGTQRCHRIYNVCATGPFWRDVTYAYTLSNTGTNAVTTTRRSPNDTPLVSTTVYDGRLRKRQVQEPAAVAKGGRIVTDTQYDTRGLAWQATRFWDGTTAPAATLAGFTNAGVQQQVLHAILHLFCRLICESHGQNRFGGRALGDQIRHAKRDCSRLARPCAGKYQQRPFGCFGGETLFRIELL